MAVRLTIGQYFDADSPLHRMDPRAKVVSALVVMVTVFFIRALPQLLLGFAFIVAVAIMSRVPIAEIARAVRPIVFVSLVLALFNLLVIHDGATLVTLGPVAITTGGALAAILFSTRLVIGMLAAALILLTTTPAQLTDAFDALLSPLSRIGAPGHELAMVFSLMLRFIPTLADEAHAVVDAQTARGAAFGQGSPTRRIRAIVSVVVALLASSLHHATDLSRALDARCYEGGATRSHWHPLRMRATDWMALAVTCAYVTTLIMLGLG